MEKLYKIIFRVEIDTLFDDNGRFDPAKMEHLVMVCTNLQNAGFQVLIVTSGAIMLGTAKMNLAKPPEELIAKQAIAAIGQADLMRQYQRFFGDFDQIVAQVLITRDVVTNPVRNKSARDTLNSLLAKGIIPIINENDSVSTDDIILNDNYPLTLIVARLIKPHAIVINNFDPVSYTLLVRNFPKLIPATEEHLFELAHTIKSGKPIAQAIGYDCKTMTSMHNSFSEQSEQTRLICGFPETIHLPR